MVIQLPTPNLALPEAGMGNRDTATVKVRDTATVTVRDTATVTVRDMTTAMFYAENASEPDFTLPGPDEDQPVRVSAQEMEVLGAKFKKAPAIKFDTHNNNNNNIPDRREGSTRGISGKGKLIGTGVNSPRP